LKPPVDYVVFGTGGWDAPWLTEQNLAHALAAGSRVLYVEPPITPLTPLRYGVGRGTVAELRRVLGSGLRRTGRVHVLRPLTIPPREHQRVRTIGGPLVRAQVRTAVRRLGLERPVVIAARSVLPFLGAAGEHACVYLVKDLVEAGGALIGKDGRAIANEQRRMCARADLVCVVTHRLQETFAARGIDATLLPHGFHAELAPAYDTARPPRDYGDLPQPRIGYAGRIDGRLDFAALAGVADRFPHGSIVLIGPVSPRLDQAELASLALRPNVHLLGPRARPELPAYLRYFDCSLMPYRESEWLTHASPLKLWDYLYAGPPLVGSGCLALRDYPLVRFANPPATLADAVETALSQDGAGRAQRRAFALANSWDDRASMLDALVRDRLARTSRRAEAPAV
jgi:hypothetical protein